jgi:hypothetical protein
MGWFLNEPKINDGGLQELNSILNINSKHVCTYLGDVSEVLHAYM